MPFPCSGTIAGVEIRPLTIVTDARGAVMPMLRSDAAHFGGFGEIYFSLVRPGAVKAWRRHREMVSNYAVPVGRILLAVYDNREGSPTRGGVLTLETGSDQYALITIPAGTWTGFAALGGEPALVANCATRPHDPAEVERLPSDDASIPYRWSL